jgi:hypothetical protein
LREEFYSPPQATRNSPREILKMRRSRTADNFKFFFGGN